MKKRLGKKEPVSKQGRKNAKPRPTLDAFDDRDADLAHDIDYIDTEEAVNEGRQSKETEELNVTLDTVVLEKGGSNEEQVNAAVSTVNISTASRPEAKLKGVEIKEMKDAERPARSILTLKPLLKLDPKDKGKGVLEEEPEPVQAELDEEARLERQRQEQASLNYTANLYDEVQARIDVDHELAKQLAEQRAAVIRNKPLTRSQLRSLMTTYLKHTGKYKHAQLNKKTLEEIQVLYIKEQERIIDFVPIRSERDERMIEKMNMKAAGVHEEKVLEEPDSTKVEVKQEGNKESTRKRLGRRLKMKATKKSRMQKTDSDLEEEEHLKTFLKLVPDKEGIIDYEVPEKRFPTGNQNSIILTDMEQNPEELYNLVMQRFKSTTPEGVDLILRSWNFYENCGVHTLILEDGTEIHMLAERKYPLTKETLERMLSLKLIAESASESTYNLLRFIQKQIDEYGSYDGSEKDL
ncbi:hypothetical protein Tco_0870879 [Tanacetum coccineum]